MPNYNPIKRYWLLTSTTYGTWLPGDSRHSVSNIDGPSGIIEPRLKLARHAETLLKSPPVLLNRPQAEVVCNQFQQTSNHRGWKLLALSVMANHFHVVVAVADNPEPKKMLVDLKAYGSRALNAAFGQPAGGWWTKGGSRRKLPDDRAVAAAVNYVLHKQPKPLVKWSPDAGPGCGPVADAPG